MLENLKMFLNSRVKGKNYMEIKANLELKIMKNLWIKTSH